jgi:hypothetical protein
VAALNPRLWLASRDLISDAAAYAVHPGIGDIRLSEGDEAEHRSPDSCESRPLRCAIFLCRHRRCSCDLVSRDKMSNPS